MLEENRYLEVNFTKFHQFPPDFADILHLFDIFIVRHFSLPLNDLNSFFCDVNFLVERSE